MRARFVLLVLVMVFIPVISASATTYEIFDFGAFGAFAINNNGQVASGTSGQAYLWDIINGMQPLGYIGGDTSSASDISDDGRVVGFSTIETSPPGGCPGGCPYHAFLWEDDGMQDLGTLGGKRSSAKAVNNLGQVAGWSDTAGDTHIHAFLYEDGVMQDLGNFGGSVNNSWAYGINNKGQVVGSAGGLSGGRHAFLYEDGVMQDLGTLGGLWSEARYISENGKIVGSPPVSGNTGSHAFFYDNGVMHDLGTLGGSSAHAYAVNNRGQVVGGSFIAGDTAGHAFLYQNSIMYDLNELINDPQWRLQTASDINDLGQIVGSGNIDLNGDGTYDEHHAFLLTPIPLVDIMPRACPNECPIKGGGFLEVIILGTAGFDANAIDIASIRLEGVAPVRSSLKDKGAPVISPSDVCDCTTEGRDGFLDLCLKFDKKEILSVLGEVPIGENIVLTLAGSLNNGAPIEGEDCIVIVKNRGKKD